MPLTPPRKPVEFAPIYRIVHLDNLKTLLDRGALHAPSVTPNDGKPYRQIHHVETQQSRGGASVPCGPQGTINDYVSFYLGPRSPMLYRLATKHNVPYEGTEEEIVYLATTAQAVQQAGLGYVFSDGHSLATFTEWFDDVGRLGELDWETIYTEWWRDKPEDNDRQRRKQAEFLVHQTVPFDLLKLIAVKTEAIKERVQALLADSSGATPEVKVKRAWYY